MSGRVLVRRWPGHGWQIALGSDRFRLWLDHRGPVLDIGRHRVTWIRPGIDDRSLLFHQRKLPARWYGRVEIATNPTHHRALNRAHR